MSTENLHVNDAREISCSASGCALSSMAAGINSRNLARVAVRRLGVCVILSVFVSCYLYGITTYGLVLGIVLGWLPSAFITWLAASGIGFMMRQRE